MRFYCDLNMFANDNETLADGDELVSNEEESNELLTHGKVQTHYFPTGMNHHCILKEPIYFLMGMGHLLIKRDGSLINGKEPPRHSQRE